MKRDRIFVGAQQYMEASHQYVFQVILHIVHVLLSPYLSGSVLHRFHRVPLIICKSVSYLSSRLQLRDCRPRGKQNVIRHLAPGFPEPAFEKQKGGVA